MDIAPFVQAIEEQGLNVRAVVVWRGGEKAAEHHWTPEQPEHVYSVSKSFTSVAIGMAIADGALSLRDRVLERFPGIIKNPDKRLLKLNLEHLLTMTRGYEEFSRPASVAEALAQELSFEPGSRFVYDNGSTFLASAMFTQAVGKTVRDFLGERLFEPLGIPAPEWEKSADGYTLGATGLWATVSQLALFGQFLLQRGNWQGKQLVPASWIDAAGRPQVSTGDSQNADYDLGYGYGFWPCRHGA
ncbi:MAG: beta-lactamase family protein, partial [Treponema sp.]|nr:beta-lactamase family protein [Treponema sp.]